MPTYETALITGASSGIGAAVARRLARTGTRVALVARRREMLDGIAAECGGGAFALAADLRDPDRVREAVAEARTRLGHLDLVIANAGISGTHHVSDVTIDSMTEIFRLNTIGACATILAALPPMLERGRGHLVGISSVAGARGLPGSSVYSASKAALSTFLESMRIDLAGTGVRVTDVRPGFVDTPLTKKNKFWMPFLLPADDAAAKILRAIERGRGVYTFPFPMAIAAALLAAIPRGIYEFASGRVAPSQCRAEPRA